MRRLPLLAALLMVALGSLTGSASAEAPSEVSVVLHGDLPGDLDCVLMKTSGGSAVDLQVGSIARALAETTAQEFAALHGQLQKVYDSSFIGTASATVSAITLASGKSTIVDQWLIEVQRLGGDLTVSVTEPDQTGPAPDPESCQ
jgi:hypothetical protein